MTVPVYFAEEPEKIPELLRKIGIEELSGLRVPVKLHMGERGNVHYLKPPLVKIVLDSLKSVGADPFLYDTVVAYPGPRSTKEGYLEVAKEHGFLDLGYDVIIGNEGIVVEERGFSFEVARENAEPTHVFVLSHGKGHLCAGFGGAIKHRGMGGVSAKSKSDIHSWSYPNHEPSKCTLCGVCAEVCPFGAITVDGGWRRDPAKCWGCGICTTVCPTGALTCKLELRKGLALSAYCVMKGRKGYYLNCLVEISRTCDCDPSESEIICPDIGFLASRDPVAVDKASLDLVNERVPDAFKKATGIDPYEQVRYGEAIGLGSTNYRLERIT